MNYNKLILLLIISFVLIVSFSDTVSSQERSSHHSKLEDAGRVLSLKTSRQRSPTAETYKFLRKWGSHGTENGQFDNTEAVAVDGSGNVYVADMGNDRIQKFSSSGTFITKWGSYGLGNGQFVYPADIAVDIYGNVYVVDALGDVQRIQKFSSTGAFITKWGSRGAGNGQFSYPSGIAVDSAANVYVADSWNNRIQKFSSTGVFIAKWGSYGTGNGQFYLPHSIAVDSARNVFVVDSFRIQKFSSTGAFITKWGSYGEDDGQFVGPDGIAVDSTGNVYVPDHFGATQRIQKFSGAGAFITKWGSQGKGNGQFESPVDLAVDSSGNVYVADYFNHRIQVFAPPRYAPQAVSVTPSSGSGASQIFSAVYSDANGNTDLKYLFFLVNTTTGKTKAANIYYVPATNRLYLCNDAGTAWTSGIVGTGTKLSNSQVSVNLPDVKIVSSGLKKTLTLPLKFKSNFAGAKNIYLRAVDNANADTGWKLKGTFTVTAL